MSQMTMKMWKNVAYNYLQFMIHGKMEKKNAILHLSRTI